MCVCARSSQSHLKKSIIDNDLLPWHRRTVKREQAVPQTTGQLPSAVMSSRPGCSTFSQNHRRRCCRCCWEFFLPGSSVSSHQSRNGGAFRKSPFCLASKTWSLTAGLNINQRISNTSHSGTRSHAGQGQQGMWTCWDNRHRSVKAVDG